MKKTYAKPKIIFEDFTLNESIAGDCEVKTYTPAKEQCGLDFGGDVIFLTSMTGCSDKYDDGEYPGICYHVPDSSNTLFNS